MSSEPARTYGGWRRSHSIGVGNLDTTQTLTLIGVVLVLSLAMAVFGPTAAGVLAVPALLVLALAVARRDGVVLLTYLVAKARYATARARGETSYRGGVMVRWPQAGALPGVLASTSLLDVEVPGRARCGLVWDRRTGLLSATMLLSTGGTLLTDRSVATGYVAAWGDVLAAMADSPSVRWAAVTVEVAPDAGTTVTADAASRLDPHAPELARAVMDDLLASAPSAAARVSARLTVTVDPEHGPGSARPRHGMSPEEAAARALGVVDGINPAAAGAEVLRLATAEDLLRIVRCAYDPGARREPAAEWADLAWHEAGPTGAEEEPDVYRHEDASSVTWALHTAPRQRVAHNVLIRLLSPGRFARRVTLLYRVLGRDEAGALLEREQTAADTREAYRRRTRRDETSRQRRDRTLAQHAADEEAAGAGLVQFTAFVTATVTDPADLPAARAEVAVAASGSRLKLRVARFGQAAGFAVGLPCGVYPPYARRR